MSDTICSNVILDVNTAEVELGQNMKMNLNFNKQTDAHDITYLVSNALQLYLCVNFAIYNLCMVCILDKCWCVKYFVQIMSRGQLVRHGHFRTKGQSLISLMIPITKDILPSFRTIAYYHTNDNEVVSDSIWVDVKDSCMGSVRNPTISAEFKQANKTPKHKSAIIFSYIDFF